MTKSRFRTEITTGKARRRMSLRSSQVNSHCTGHIFLKLEGGYIILALFMSGMILTKRKETMKTTKPLYPQSC